MIKRTAMLVKMDQAAKTGSADGSAGLGVATIPIPNAQSAAQPSPSPERQPVGASLANTGLARKSSFRRSEAQRRRDERRDSAHLLSLLMRYPIPTHRLLLRHRHFCSSTLRSHLPSVPRSLLF